MSGSLTISSTIYVNKKDVLYFCAYGLYLVFAILSTTFYLKYFIGTIYTVILSFCLALLIIHRLSRGRMTAKQFVWIVIAFLSFFVVYQISGLSVAILLPFIFFSTGVKFDKIAKFTETLELCVLLFVVVTSKLGIVENYIYDVSGRYREYLGFRYALYPMVMMFNIIALNLYTNRNKKKNYSIIFLLAFAVYLYLKTGSRLAFYLSLLLIVVNFLTKNWERIFNFKVIKMMLCSIYILCCAFSFWISVTYNASSSWMSSLNDFLGNRISMAQISLLRYGLSLQGIRTDWVGMGLDVYGNREVGTAFYVDNFYVKVSQQYGVIFLFILLLILTVSMVIAYRERDWSMILILSIFAIHGLIDDLMLSVPYNTFLIYIGTKVAIPVKRTVEKVYSEKLRGGVILDPTIVLESAFRKLIYLVGNPRIFGSCSANSLSSTQMCV